MDAPDVAMAKTRATHLEVIKSAVSLASKRSFDHLLYVGDLLLPEDVFRGKSGARKKLVQAVVSEATTERLGKRK